MHKNSPKARLILADGTVFTGKGFGSKVNTAGEAVFNTAMTGYPECLTDPSYEGQILINTFPLQGNYGVPLPGQAGNLSRNLESERIHVRGLIVQDYTFNESHWMSALSLDRWLKNENIPGIYGIDTRALTIHLREHGSMPAKIIFDDDREDSVDWYDPNKENLIAKTSCTEVTVYEPEKAEQVVPTVILVDCGVKHNIVRCLNSRGVRVVRVPWNFDYTDMDYDGIMITNGPGNPDMAVETVDILRRAMKAEKPVCGICMGNQLLAKAAGASIYKLKYGHRSHNQPVRLVGTNRCFITSQNHGFAVNTDSLPDDWEPLFVNMNDGTNEGIRHKTKPFFSTQFHPEASSGPTDTEFIFDKFVDMLR